MKGKRMTAFDPPPFDIPRPLPDRIREALAKRRAAVIPSGLRYAEIDPDLIEALLADNDRLRAVVEAARWLYDHTNRTQPRYEAYWNQDAFIALGRELTALDAARDAGEESR